MPDWSYRTFLRPLLGALGAERGRRVAVRALRRIGRTRGGGALIDFLGHMRADERLRVRVGGVELAGPVVLGATLDPRGEALAALSRFGVGLVEVGPVTRDNVDEIARNLEEANVPVAIRLGDTDLVPRLEPHATLFVVDTKERLDAVKSTRPIALRVTEDALPVTNALTIAGGVRDPEDAKRLLDAGADLVAIDEGILTSGPGLPKRCNEALLSTMPSTNQPEPLTLDAARRAWFWALVLGVAMFAGG
ncbi:MAG TPA: hypothetical protein VHK90_08325, partial [Thermoanaerobaculia bacterium]|nr:hypothetical protein [Thermoanaerobaculia bacterium]